MGALLSWHWPGNVRELENFMERSVILTEDGAALYAPLAELMPESARVAVADTTLEAAEREHIIRVLRQCGGLVSGARGAAQKLIEADNTPIQDAKAENFSERLRGVIFQFLLPFGFGKNPTQFQPLPTPRSLLLPPLLRA
jgi:transcriptional regulator with AAA-type ATPase domain